MDMFQFAQVGVKLAMGLRMAASDIAKKNPEFNTRFAVLLGGHMAVALWVEAILEATSAKKIANSDELEEFRRYVNLAIACQVKRGASKTPLAVEILGYEKIDQKHRDKLLEVLVPTEDGALSTFMGANFQVTFRETGNANRPATSLQIPKRFGVNLSKDRVLVEDPTSLVADTVASLMSHYEEVKLQAHPSTRQFKSLFYNHYAWDDLAVLYHLFKLMRIHDLKKPTFNRFGQREEIPDWGRAPFGAQAWNETFDALNGLKKGRTAAEHEWMQQAAEELETISDRSLQDDLQALKYFITFYESHSAQYKDSPTWKATFPNNDRTRLPKYPGYPSEHPHYTSHPRQMSDLSVYDAVAR